MKFIIFDIDGTLSNTTQVDDDCYLAAYQETFQADTRDHYCGDFKHVTDWGITEELTQRKLNRLPTDAEYEQMISNFEQQLAQSKTAHPERFNEIPGAKAFFEFMLTQPQYGIGLATGCWETSALFKLNAVGIELPPGIAFGHSNHDKSREGITRHAIQQLKAQYPEEPESIIYFGDGLWDFHTCNNLGLPLIGIDVSGNGKLKELGVQTVFRDYGDQGAVLAAIEAL